MTDALLRLLGECLPLFLAAALHEIGHLSACLVLRVPVRFLHSSLTGAVIGYDSTRTSYPAEAVIAAAGPLFGLLGTVCVLRSVSRQAALFGTASLALSLFNLLPITPLDGAVILSALLSCRLSPHTVSRILRATSCVCAVLLWMSAVTVQLRCGGNLSLLFISVLMLTKITEKY